jgi:hypothetical protein
MTPDQLRAMAAMLYGVAWQGPLARDLDIAVRSVQRWSSGVAPIPDSILPKFEHLCRNRAAELLNTATWLHADAQLKGVAPYLGKNNSDT